MNTIERLNTLPEPYRTLALAEIENVRRELADDPELLSGYNRRLNLPTEEMADAAWRVFSVFYVVSGIEEKHHLFWKSVARAVDSGKPLPPIPDFYQ